MKMKKLLFAILLLITGSMSAQKYLVKITDKDGNEIEIPTIVAGEINEDFSFEELTANKTLTASDFITNSKFIYNNSANDYIVRVPDVATLGKSLIFRSDGTGRITVYMEPGVTGPAFVTSDDDAVTLLKDPNGYSIEGARTTPACIPDTNEQHNDINAASDSSRCEEANATLGFTASISQVTLESSTDADTGTYAIRVFRNTSGGGAGYVSYFFPATIGDQFTVTWRSKKNAGSFSFAAAWQNIVTPIGFNAPGDGVFESETENIEAASTGNIELRWYSDSDGLGVGGGTPEDYIVDNLRIVKTN